MNKTRTT